jgi:hypothetical protein
MRRIPVAPSGQTRVKRKPRRRARRALLASLRDRAPLLDEFGGLSGDPTAAKQWCCLVPWKVDNGPYIAAVGCCRNANKQFPPASRSGAGGDKESSP